MTDYKVSIITPVYNAERTLKKCVDSICGQTFNNFELILINDGSKDNSLAICEEYASKDSRIRVHTQMNAGPSAARNAGIELATGTYLAFIDSDDYVEANMIERMIQTAEENSADMVICGFCEEDDTSVRPHRFSHRNGFYNEEECRAVALDCIDNNSKSRIPPYSWIRMIRKEIIEDPALRYNTSVKRSEDYLLWVQVHFRIKSMYLMGDEILYHYVNNPVSITRSYLHGYWPMCKTIYEELNRNLPQTSEVKKRIQAMLIQRSLIAFHNASNTDHCQFEKDAEEVLNDKELIKAAWNVGLVRNSKRARIYALMVMMRLKPLIKRTFSK